MKSASALAICDLIKELAQSHKSDLCELLQVERRRVASDDDVDAADEENPRAHRSMTSDTPHNAGKFRYTSVPSGTPRPDAVGMAADGSRTAELPGISLKRNK